MKTPSKLTWSEIKEYNRKNTDIRYSRVTFGKYRGYFLKEVPVDYVRWAVLNLTDSAQATYFAEELLRREPTEYSKK